MSKFKMLFLQTSFISLGIFLAVGTAQTVLHFFGNAYATEWYFLLSVIFAGVLCSLPSLILYNEKIKPFFIKILIHFTLVFAAVSLLGWLKQFNLSKMSNLVDLFCILVELLFFYCSSSIQWVHTKKT